MRLSRAYVELSIYKSKLDEDVQVKDFDKYMKMANFTSPPNKALMILSDEEEDLPIKGFVRPEDTPGGALMAGLNFCAEDKRDDCPGIVPSVINGGELRGAQTVFWAGAYQMFGNQVQGSLVIAILGSGSGNKTSLIEAAIGELDSSSVSQVTLFLEKGKCDKSIVVSKLAKDCRDAGIKIACTKDLHLLHPDLSCLVGRRQPIAAAFIPPPAVTAESSQAGNHYLQGHTDKDVSASNITYGRLVVPLAVLVACTMYVVHKGGKKTKHEYDTIPDGDRQTIKV